MTMCVCAQAKRTYWNSIKQQVSKQSNSDSNREKKRKPFTLMLSIGGLIQRFLILEIHGLVWQKKKLALERKFLPIPMANLLLLLLLKLFRSFDRSLVCSFSSCPFIASLASFYRLLSS